MYAPHLPAIISSVFTSLERMRRPSLLSALAAAAALLPVAVAEMPAFQNDVAYDQEVYGKYPTQQFMSAPVTAPHVNILQWSPECDSSLLTFLAPRGFAVQEPQITILDHQGHLVWTRGWNGQQLYNLRVQRYQGENYLTFWAGDDTVGGHGAGDYWMLDKHYQTYKKIQAADGLQGDLHDFMITEEGTALLTVYEVVQLDLTSAGKPFVGPVWDCLIQEVNITSGELVFQWRASDFWRLEDSYRPIGDDGEGDRAYDFFHINSIEKDSRGNYLTSARYTRSLTYIDGRTGEVLWVMGGKRNMFQDLSSGHATSFAYQHDARWTANCTEITMFDNGVEDSAPTAGDTRGLRIRVDQAAMTVQVAAEYINPLHIHGVSQGSYQTLPGSGNALLGYGNSPAYTEFSPAGKPLCDVHFGPQNTFGHAEIMSYRVLKYEWHGWPTTIPDVLLGMDAAGLRKLYVSWNGATEVAVWVLRGAASQDAADWRWKDLERIKKVQFETEFLPRMGYPHYLRVAALDAGGRELGISGVLNTTEIAWTTPALHIQEENTWLLKSLMAVSSLLTLGMGWRIALSTWNSWRLRRKHASYRVLHV